MKILTPCLCCFLSIAASTCAQNLVPNPGFENYNNCTPGDNLLDTSSTYFPYIKNWMSAGPLSPYTFASCMGNVPNTLLYGYHQAHSGSAFAGITTCTQFHAHDSICHLCWNDRTYVQVQLTEPLKKDTQYCVEFFIECAVVNVNGTFYVSTARVGACLSSIRPQNYFAGGPYSLLKNITPQVENSPDNYISDTLHWQSIHGVYKAKGGEQWLTIGNFYSDSLTPVKYFVPVNPNDVDSISDMLIDDVSVTPITFPQATKDTLLCDTSQFTKTLSAQPGGDDYRWNTGDTNQAIIVHQPGTYWYNTDFGCGKVVDSVHIYYQPPLGGHLPADTNGCAANMPLYLAIDSGFTHYSWNTGDTTAAIAISDSGTYNVHAVYACGAFADTVHVVIYPQPDLPVSIDTAICVNTGNYPALIPGHNVYYYSSVTDSTGSLLPPVIANANTTDYTFYAAQQVNGCFSGRSKEQVHVITAPVPQVINNVVLCEGSLVQIGDANNSYHYQWNTGDTTNLVSTGTAGVYLLTESNICGSAMEEITVTETNCNSCLFVPDAFTPNGDGNNDVFKVFTNCPLNFFRCMIFDRAGEKVFESNNPLETWDGTYKSSKLNPGVFVYVITYVSANEETETLKGSVTLIR